MQVCWLILILGAFACPLLTKSEIRPVLINQFSLPHAYYSTLLHSWTLNSSTWVLVISCYNSLLPVTDYVYSVSNIEWQLTTNITPTVLTDQITHPNGVVSADPLVPYSIIVPSGGPGLGKTNGNLYFLGKDGPTALVPNDRTNWFYHDADFKDMDGDGHIDIVAGRAYVPKLGNAQTQLIWLKNPGNSTITGPWNLTVILPQGGPDMEVQFAYVDNTEVLFAAAYYSRKLQLFWSDSDPYWNDSTHVHVRHIDYEPFQFAYNHLTTDINGDQIPDLLVTIRNGFDGSLIVYELPPSGHLLNGQFKKHVIASGFKPTSSGGDRGSPGQGKAVQLYSVTARKKPIVLLSGDDDGCVYLLEAVHDDDPQDWQYYMTTIHQSNGTVGQISVEDVDSDGHPELFVPVYTEGMVYIYRLMDN